ncbi:MAG: DUF86 domain-containing protein [Mariprofundaceae bacterium]|nr:DUF86 domain-containing protein [Mariprofundaceae bacterium]
MSRKSWQPYALHIIDSIDKIYHIRARGDITIDDVLYDATLRNLQTLSEATQSLPDEFKTIHSEIPWKQISGFRNILVHNYLGDIDPQTVVKVIEDYLQPLKGAVFSMLDDNA